MGFPFLLFMYVVLMRFRPIKALVPAAAPFFSSSFPPSAAMYNNKDIDENTHLLRFKRDHSPSFTTTTTPTTRRLPHSATLHDSIQETISILALAWPLLITFVVGYGMKLVDVWFLGRLDTEGKHPLFAMRKDIDPLQIH